MWLALGSEQGGERQAAPSTPPPLWPNLGWAGGADPWLATGVCPDPGLGQPPPKWPKINTVWRMEMSLWPTGESFSEIGFKLHYTSNFMGT